MTDHFLLGTDILSLSGNELKDKTSDVKNDYGTPNLLFFYYTPTIPSDKQDELAAVQKDFYSWNAWELAVAESQLQTQLKKGTLPSDDSTESREKRATYRAKVDIYLRENSEDGWLLLDRTPTSSPPFSKTVKKSEVNGVIRQVLRDHYATAKEPSQLGVMINLISDVAAYNPSVEHKYYWTNALFQYNSDLIQALTFTVTQTPVKGSADSVNLRIETLDNVYKLDMDEWKKARGKVNRDLLDSGEKIRKEMALDFALDS
ncbi:hypothetical protein F66182_3293 [Fusarium sp. NRRL 66182]|nr:hypothetical protein F66182_3293 [Fusarium sp. NRRL 66182]